MINTDNLVPVNIDTQLKNMKLYVHFTKKKNMTTFLKSIGYFRSSRYGKFLISRSNDLGAKPSQKMLFDLYNFDLKLRELFFHYCQIAEIQFKAYLADSVALILNNAYFYLDECYYTLSRSERNKIKRQSNIRFFKKFYKALVNESSALIKNSIKYPELKEYRKGGTKETSVLPCWVFFNYIELGSIVNIYAYLRGDLRIHVLKYNYSRDNYRKISTKQFDTWLEALRNLRNICAHHNILVGKTSSIVLPEQTDSYTLTSNTDLFFRLYALKKILPPTEHNNLKNDLAKLIRHSKLDIIKLGILPLNWEEQYENINIF